MKNKLYKSFYLLFALGVLAFTACNKEIVTGEDPYAGGKGSLGIGFITNYPTPNVAKPGELVDFNVKGLKPYLGKIDFFVNNTKVEIVTAQDSLVTIKVPAEISSGDAKIVVDGQVFYGPRLEIEGNTSLDENYGMINGFRGSVYDILPNAGGFIVAGYFNNFENEAVDKETYRNGIHFIDASGKTSSTMSFGKGTGATGGVNSIAKLSNGSFIVGGNFTSFNGKQVYGLAKLYSNGELDSTVVDVINTTENPKNSLDTVSSFNAGVYGGPVLKVFSVTDDKVIVVGNFSRYFKIDYDYSSRDNRRSIVTEAKHVIRLRSDGSLDSTYIIKNEGANGMILDATMIDNERILVIGSFTSYNGKAAPGIVCLNADGSVDPAFNLSGSITRFLSVTYNEENEKIALTGIFSGLGGNANAKSVALLNTDGSVDNQFVLGNIGTGIVSYAQVLNNEQVVVQGSMDTYNGIGRGKMLILEKDGKLLQKYNSQAPFSGSIFKIVETKSSTGEPALLVGGSVSQYGVKTVGNFFRLEIKE
ncbi:DUF5008 domain-containing protein [Sphingobacterium sp. SRCM116780]|uniref:DUF5008 domain-containing protein n=1 Tax=Sphingobacterium sp. SRCM116780 TaxID=2907623 RepID=UPI001F35F17D|nr:DUF5008 domain-containing protein [Sphingobacterium sp. SRCM116780]UIR55382.1 DUF5008 domain-containing protein [Sphingobacterium sp. SRCM116780]